MVIHPRVDELNGRAGAIGAQRVADGWPGEARAVADLVDRVERGVGQAQAVAAVGKRSGELAEWRGPELGLELRAVLRDDEILSRSKRRIVGNRGGDALGELPAGDVDVDARVVDQLDEFNAL